MLFGLLWPVANDQIVAKGKIDGFAGVVNLVEEMLPGWMLSPLYALCGLTYIFKSFKKEKFYIGQVVLTISPL